MSVPAQPGQPTPGANQTQQPSVQLLSLPQVDISQLDVLQGGDKNNFVGNSIYGIIQAQYGDEYAPRITGMLLDENAIDFKMMLTNAQYFTGKVQEAYVMIQSQGAVQQQWMVHERNEWLWR